jgi:hypothetical protein
MPTGPTRSLILVYEARFMDPADFDEIARRIAERAPDIWARAVDNYTLHRTLARRMGELPCLTVCPFPLRNFRPARGRIYQGIRLGKIAEAEMLSAAGVAVPPWTIVDAATRLDPDEWGPLVVVKREFGSQGTAVRLVRTDRLAEHLAERARNWRPRPGRLIAQRHIDPGERPTTYRVMSLFAEPLYARSETRNRPETLPAPDSVPDGGLEIGVNRDPDNSWALDSSADLLDFARRAHRALPEVPVVGLDIIRERGTGALFALEANSRGYVWHLSSEIGRTYQARHGIDYYAQFGALDRAAEVLIERTRAEAI